MDTSDGLSGTGDSFLNPERESAVGTLSVLSSKLDTEGWLDGACTLDGIDEDEKSLLTLCEGQGATLQGDAGSKAVALLECARLNLAFRQTPSAQTSVTKDKFDAEARAVTERQLYETQEIYTL